MAITSVDEVRRYELTGANMLAFGLSRCLVSLFSGKSYLCSVNESFWQVSLLSTFSFHRVRFQVESETKLKTYHDLLPFSHDLVKNSSRSLMCENSVSKVKFSQGTVFGPGLESSYFVSMYVLSMAVHRPVTRILFGGVLTRPKWTKPPKCIFYCLIRLFRKVAKHEKL